MAPVGRPSVMTQNVLDKLEYAFSLGCTDNEACLHADINPTTLYKYQEDHPKFTERKARLKEKPVFQARKAVIDGFTKEKNPEIAMKYLERKKKSEFSLRQELDTKHSFDKEIKINITLDGDKFQSES